MKRITILIFLFNFKLIFSQTNGRITYKAFFTKPVATEELRNKNIIRYQESLDEEMMAKMLTFNLDFNSNESLFYLSKSLISEHENQDTKKYVTGLFYGYDKIYINKTKDTLIEQLFYSSGKILKLKKANFIKWSLTKETKNIIGYKCYKATYTYIQKWRGKEFPWKITAWYTPKILQQYGPIRYSGLPGLILELSEENRSFVANKIQYFDKKLKIKTPNEGKLYMKN